MRIIRPTQKRSITTLYGRTISNRLQCISNDKNDGDTNQSQSKKATLTRITGSANIYQCACTIITSRPQDNLNYLDIFQDNGTMRVKKITQKTENNRHKNYWQKEKLKQWCQESLWPNQIGLTSQLTIEISKRPNNHSKKQIIIVTVFHQQST